MKNISRWLICITLVVAMVVTLGLAACEPTTVKATFEGGGSGATGDAPDDISKEIGSQITLPQNTFEFADHTFAGWSDGENTYQAGDKYTLRKDTTFTAQWTQNQPTTYTLSFELGDHAADTATTPEQRTLAEDGTTTLPDAPAAESGYQFDGWYHGETKYEAGATFTMPAENVTLTARFVSNEEEKLFGDELVGTWGSIFDNKQIVITSDTFSYDGETKEITKNSDTSYTFDGPSGEWTFEVIQNGENLLIKIQISANTIYFFEREGEQTRIAIPEQYRGKTFSRGSEYEYLVVDSDGYMGFSRSFVDEGTGSTTISSPVRYFYHDEAAGRMYCANETSSGTTMYLLTLGDNSIGLSGISGYPDWTFKLQGTKEDLTPIECDPFDTEYIGYWRTVNEASKNYIEIGEKSFFYRTSTDGSYDDIGNYYAANITDGTRSVTLGGKTYTITMTKDHNMIVLVSASGNMYFVKGRYDATYDLVDFANPSVDWTTIFPEFVDSDFTSDPRVYQYFASEGQPDIYFEPRTYTEDQYVPTPFLGSDRITILTWDSAQHSGTLFSGSGWYEFAISGDTLDTFELTLTDLQGQSHKYTKKEIIPEIKIDIDYTGTWIAANGDKLIITQKGISIQLSGWSEAQAVVATFDDNVLKYTYNDTEYTITLYADDNGIYTTDESGTKVSYYIEYLGMSQVLNVTGINGTKWQNADGSIIMEIKSFKPVIEGKDIRIITKPISASTSIAGGTYYAFYEGNFYTYSASLSEIKLTPCVEGLGEEIIFTSYVEQGGGDDGDDSVTFPEKYRGDTWTCTGGWTNFTIVFSADSFLYMGKTTYSGNLTYNEKTGVYTLTGATVVFLNDDICLAVLGSSGYIFTRNNATPTTTIPQEAFGSYSDGTNSATLDGSGITTDLAPYGTTLAHVQDNGDGSYTIWVSYQPKGSYTNTYYRWTIKDGTITVQSLDGETLFTLTLQQ